MSHSEYADNYFERAQQMLALGPLPGTPEHRILLALGFAFAHDQADVFIVGTRNPAHLKANINWVNPKLPIAPEAVRNAKACTVCIVAAAGTTTRSAAGSLTAPTPTRTARSTTLAFGLSCRRLGSRSRGARSVQTGRACLFEGPKLHPGSPLTGTHPVSSMRATPAACGTGAGDRSAGDADHPSLSAVARVPLLPVSLLK